MAVDESLPAGGPIPSAHRHEHSAGVRRRKSRKGSELRRQRAESSRVASIEEGRARVLDATHALTPERFVLRPPRPPELPKAA